MVFQYPLSIALAPVIENNTWRSGKYYMMERFRRIYDELRIVAEQQGHKLAMTMAEESKSSVTEYTKQLKEFDQVTKFLQRQHLSLYDCRIALDTFTESVTAQNTNNQSPFFDCMLKDEFISQSSHLELNKAFETGVVKIRRGYY